ncbi:hypothetical protein [Nissabacter archeti]|uniref:hypothetical protein n=1 Tax=Nissabacter archeti TaxID=1917880 RepID=UPI0009353EE3|nr:hypothetical protein [Nissabacter archeti]
MEQIVDDRQAWLAAGWKRGAFVNISEHPQLLDEFPKKLTDFIGDKKNPFLIPILYDCALIEESFDKEPWAQVLFCWEVEHNGNYANAKNPRCLHTKAFKNGEAIWLEISAIGFSQVDRENLLKVTPDNSMVWEEGRLPQLLDWVSERYRQPTFPDAFNNRIRPIQKRLEALWKGELFRDYCAGVYFRLSTFDELDVSEKYKLDIIILIPYEIQGRSYAEFDAKNSGTMIESLKSKLAPLEGIELGSIETYPESEFTKELERKYIRFSLEYFSYNSKSGIKTLPADFSSQGW